VRRPARDRRGPARGVSFVELLLVVSILAVVALLILPTARNVQRRAQETQLRRALVTIRTALDEYHRDWERGYIESDDDQGWPETLEELTEEIEYRGPAEGPAAQRPTVPGAGPPIRDLGRGGQEGLDGLGEAEPVPKIYLPRLPRDPFNLHGDEWDTAGWRARAYDDEPDDTSWGGENVYDVYSASPWTALDGSRYEDW